MTKTFPALPKDHLVKALKIIWTHTCKLKDANILQINIPTGLLDVRNFPLPFNSLTSTLFDIYNQACSSEEPDATTTSDTMPSITKSIPDFIHCCALVLGFRSYFQYSSNHCPDGIPPSVELFQAGTAGMIAIVNKCVNRGVGANGWNIQKVADLVHLPLNVMDLVLQRDFMLALQKEDSNHGPSSQPERHKSAQVESLKSL